MAEAATVTGTASGLHAAPVQGPALVTLDDSRAEGAALTGSKAANLARARRAGLPVTEGLVVTTAAAEALVPTGTCPDPAPGSELHAGWLALSAAGTRPLVVRSSSVGEDLATSSMAGRFASVLNVAGWEPFVDAVLEVLASAIRDEGAPAPMAVLVQPELPARFGGVLFGLDPFTGDRRHLVASLTEGAPDRIVGGSVTGSRGASHPPRPHPQRRRDAAARPSKGTWKLG